MKRGSFGWEGRMMMRMVVLGNGGDGTRAATKTGPTAAEVAGIEARGGGSFGGGRSSGT